MHKYKEAEGIDLEHDKIKKKSSVEGRLKTVLKLVLNYHVVQTWGRFGQRDNLKQTEIADTTERLCSLASGLYLMMMLVRV